MKGCLPEALLANGEENIYDLIENSTADQNRFMKMNKPKDSLELWDAISLFANGSNREKDGTINLIESKKPHLFEALSLNIFVDIKKIADFEGLAIAVKHIINKKNI